MKDYLLKAVACNEHVRIYICSTTALVEEARTRFDLWPTASAALGRTLTVGSMMGSMLKSDKEQLTIRINGGGPIGTVLVDAYSDGHVRGFVSNPHIHYQYNDTGKLAVGIAVGKEGTLEVIKDMGMKENWSGAVALQSGEIGDDFAYYFTVSEQTPSAVSVGVLVDTDNHIISAGGLILQMMPDADEEDIRRCEEALSKLAPMSTLIKEKDSLEQILEEMLDDVKILSSQDVCFKCHCSKTTMKRVLTTLSMDEIDKMIDEDHGCEITCNFCNERYHFSEEELRDLKQFIENFSRKTSWSIRDVEIANRLVIAPMAGVSNIAFRGICKRFGAGLVCAEMVSDKALFYDNVKTLHMTQVMDDEHPMSLQIFGHDIESMVYAAKLLDQQTGCDIIDINMGCPVNKVIKAHAGSALMKEPEHAQKLVEAVVAAVQKPVTVKFRSGFDSAHINAVDFAKRMEAAGASAICIHGRTRAQMYEGKADWGIIADVKRAVQIPVIGNGDVRSVEDMVRMFEETNVDAVAIGRGVLGDPWLIRQCSHYLTHGEKLPQVTYQERFAIAREHARKLTALKGENVGMKEMRGHATWYIKGLPGSHPVKEKLSRIATYAEFDHILREYEEMLDNHA